MSLDLDHVQQGQFHEALMKAFNRVALEKLLRYKMDVDINRFAASPDLDECTMKVIEWANSHGRFEELVRHALEERKTNPHLLRFAEKNRIVTSVHTVELPALDLAYFEAPPKKVRSAQSQLQVKSRPIKHYREDIFLTQADARAKGFTEQDQFGILTIQPLTPNKADVRVAVHVQVDDRGVDAGQSAVRRESGAAIQYRPYLVTSDLPHLKSPLD
jgi:hypothetical protein